MRGLKPCRSVPGSVSRCPRRFGAASGPEHTASARSLPTVCAPSSPSSCTSPGRAQRVHSGLQEERGPSCPTSHPGQDPRGAERSSEVLRAVQSWGPAVLLTPGPGSLDSKILVKASELPVRFFDVPAETGRPWGRGGSLGCGLASVAYDLVTLGGPGFPLGSPSPWGCRGLRETERSCVVSSKAPPGGGFVNGGGW